MHKDYYIVKLDSSGNIMWHKMYGGNSDDEVVSVTNTINDALIILGSSSSDDIPAIGYQGMMDFYLLKIDPTLNVVLK